MARKTLKERFREAGLPEHGPYTEEQKVIGRRLRAEAMEHEFDDIEYKPPKTCCEDCPFRAPDYKDDDGNVILEGYTKGVCDVFGDNKPTEYVWYRVLCPYYAGKKYAYLMSNGEKDTGAKLIPKEDPEDDEE